MKAQQKINKHLRKLIKKIYATYSPERIYLAEKIGKRISYRTGRGILSTAAPKCIKISPTLYVYVSGARDSTEKMMRRDIKKFMQGMDMFQIQPLQAFKAKIQIPPDKSISHRSILIAAIASGTIKIKNFLACDDTEATVSALRVLGTKINWNKKHRCITVYGRGKYFAAKNPHLWVNQSGTTFRLIAGILAGQKSSSVLTADAALMKRPMKRIIEPLTRMHARVYGRKNGSEEYPPLHFKPAPALCGISYRLPVASAQVKSAILLAGLYAQKTTSVIEPIQTRDHTERMLRLYRVRVDKKNNRITLHPGVLCAPTKPILIPADFSSAAFFIALGILLKKACVILPGININPTRIGLLKVLRRMNAKITLKHISHSHFEPHATIIARTSHLKGTTVQKKEIPSLIDELPILGVIACFAKGVTKICGIQELRVKETDRIKALKHLVETIGGEFSLKEYSSPSGQKNICIQITPKNSAPTRVCFRSFSDHRIAMSAIVAGMVLPRGAILNETKSINKSFPEFLKLIKQLSAKNHKK